MFLGLELAIRRPFALVLSGALISSAVGMAGCSRPSGSPHASSPAAAVVNDQGARPSESDANQFATDLIAAIKANDLARFNALVDWTVVLEEATAGIDVPADWRRGFQTGFLNSLGKPGGVFERLAALPKAGGALTLLRVHEVEGRPRALIRTNVTGQGVNYLDFELGRLPDGKICAKDFYIFMSGERISKTIRDLYLPLAANQSRGVLAKLLTKESDMVKAFPKINQLTTALRDGRAREAIAIYDSLPAAPETPRASCCCACRLRRPQTTTGSTWPR